LWEESDSGASLLFLVERTWIFSFNFKKLQIHKDMAKITVNGEAQEVQLPLNLTELIKQNDVAQPDMVSVQVNDEFTDRTEWDTIQIKEGDVVDFLYFMGGGAL
jgi:sulfur carrier protein